MLPEKEKNQCTTIKILRQSRENIITKTATIRYTATFQLPMLVFSHCKNTEQGFLIKIQFLLRYHDILYVQYIFLFKGESK